MTDQDRFAKFIKVIPEEDIRHWMSDIVFQSAVSKDIYQKLLNFDEFSENLNGHFFDKPIQDRFALLRDANSALMMYLAKNFQIRTQGKFIKLSKEHEEAVLQLLQRLETLYREFIKFTLPKLFHEQTGTNQAKTLSNYFDVDGRVLRVGNKEVTFKGYQLKLMTLLSSKQGKVFDYSEIYSVVYGEHKLKNAVMQSLIDKIVYAIHKKLKKNGIEDELIKRAGGYKLVI